MLSIIEQKDRVQNRIKNVSLARFCLLRGFRLRRLKVWMEALEKLTM